MGNTKQILLLHGGTTYRDYDEYLKALKDKKPKLEWIVSTRDWKNELQNQLGNDFVVYVPQMPNKTNAQYEEWKVIFEKIVDLLDDDFILIGHSLGALFITKYLSENKISKTIKKTFLLGTPFDDTLEHESLNSFVRKGDLKGLENQSGRLFFYQSKDDFAVPFEHVEKYEKELPNATYRKYKEMNHFLVEKIPDLLEDIKNNL